jgi:hypothetical protein
MASASSTSNAAVRPTPAKPPTVSVLMPTYDGERFLRPAIESILNQTFSDFELIVVDDASTDSTPQILAELRDKDPRLIVLTNDRNLGIAGATNRALAAARGQYVALQDHDDISLPHRFQTQVDFLNSHPDIAVVGSAATLIDDVGNPCGDAPLGIWANRQNLQSHDDLDLTWDLLFGCPIYHTSVTVRRNAILDLGGYRPDPAFQCAQDFELLSRLAMRYRVASLKEVLVLWRRHSGTVGRQQSEQQLRANEAISSRNLWAVYDLRTGQVESTSDQRSFRYLGLKAFLCMPEGKLPDLPAGQVISGAQFLSEINEKFYRMRTFPRSAVARHRAPLNWLWGKHAIALSIRAPWDVRSRARMFWLGLITLGRATRAACSHRLMPEGH